MILQTIADSNNIKWDLLLGAHNVPQNTRSWNLRADSQPPCAHSKRPKFGCSNTRTGPISSKRFITTTQHGTQDLKEALPRQVYHIF